MNIEKIRNLRFLDFIIPETEAKLDKVILGLVKVLEELRQKYGEAYIQIRPPWDELRLENEICEILLLVETQLESNTVVAIPLARIDVLENRPWPVTIFVAEGLEEQSKTVIDLLFKYVKMRRTD